MARAAISANVVGPRGAAPGQPEALTAREREVVALVGGGLTNRQIAERLIITEGTAKRHVENILTKLDLSGRVEIAAWATRHGLAPDRGA